MKNWSLRIKITILVGLVTLTACIALTANAIVSADSYYGTYIEEAMIYKDEVQSLDKPAETEEYEILGPTENGVRPVTRRFSVRSFSVMALVVGISLLLAYWITGRILRPLEKLTTAIHDINQDNLHERVSLPDATGEVQQLTQSFNALLVRLDESFALQRQFSSNAAHELKTPLAVMKTSLQVLEMEEQPDQNDYQDFIEDTRDGLERLIRTVDNLLALTKETEGEVPEEVSFDELFSRVKYELAGKAEEKGVNLNVICSGDTLTGNRTLLYRVLYNLAENAVKYNQPGGSIDIRIIEENGKKGLEIRDTGAGMDEETLKHVCEPFYRADESRSQEIPGSGLGLSIVKMMMERMGGRLEISSRLCEGTVVRCWFSGDSPHT